MPGRGTGQELVDAHFAAAAAEWAQIYEGSGVYEAIHQERLRRVLDIAAGLGLPPGTRVLDAGCGAGFASAGLAGTGFTVEAVDPVPAMVAATEERARRGGWQDRVHVGRGDVTNLAFANGSFALVTAVGLLPWLAAPSRALQEMSRVLQPGGHLICTIDNRWALRNLVEPLANPLLQPMKQLVRALLLRHPRARSYRMAQRQCRALLAAAGLAPVQSATIGFGPVSFFGRDLLPRSAGLRLDRRLQALADRGVPVLRAGGTQYVVLARKPE